MIVVSPAVDLAHARRLVQRFVMLVVLGLLAALVAPGIAAALGAQPTNAGDVVETTSARTVDGARLVRWSRPVATRTIARGDTLHTADIAWRDTVLTHAIPRLAPTDTVVPEAGWIARRTVNAGEWLRAPAVVPPPLVTAGQSVVALLDRGDVRLVLRGVALRTAARGEPVVVRIERTRRLDAIAIAPDTVRLR